MKHLKTYEEKDFNRFEVGDIVVLLSIIPNYETKFIVGDIYRVNATEFGDNVPYNIINNDGKTSWTFESRLRKATDEEIKEYEIRQSAKKYNL